jgi:hypothetical protein
VSRAEETRREAELRLEQARREAEKRLMAVRGAIGREAGTAPRKKAWLLLLAAGAGGFALALLGWRGSAGRRRLRHS